jgi:hypothetical protein
VPENSSINAGFKITSPSASRAGLVLASGFPRLKSASV